MTASDAVDGSSKRHASAMDLGAVRRTHRTGSAVSVENDPARIPCHGTNPRIWISLSLVVTARGERNAATRWKRATGQGSARE
jgi:hypothetical protein